MSDQEDDIILSDLNDEDLVAQMFDDLYDGLERRDRRRRQHFARAQMGALSAF